MKTLHVQIDFVNVNIALNSNAYGKKLEFFTRVHKKVVSFVVL